MSSSFFFVRELTLAFSRWTLFSIVDYIRSLCMQLLYTNIRAVKGRKREMSSTSSKVINLARRVESMRVLAPLRGSRLFSSSS